MRQKALISWSSGKDSAWALHVVRQEGDFEVAGAITTVTHTFARVSMHGVREELLAAQLDACGLEPIIARIPSPCSNEIYEREMGAAMAQAKASGITHVIFGDLFLEDVRAYREARLASAGMHAVFPLWGQPSDKLARKMIDAGLEARLVCVDLKALPKNFAGRSFDRNLLDDLPAEVDPCGERGEFHTFVTNGPMLQRPINVNVGETIERDGFAFADLLPA